MENNFHDQNDEKKEIVGLPALFLVLCVGIVIPALMSWLIDLFIPLFKDEEINPFFLFIFMSFLLINMSLVSPFLFETFTSGNYKIPLVKCIFTSLLMLFVLRLVTYMLNDLFILFKNSGL